MLQELLTLNVFNFLLVFARVGSALLLLPGFSAVYVNVRSRIAIGLTVSFVMMPAVANGLPGLPAAPAALGLLILGEILIGVFIGSLGFILLAALHVAGTLIAYFSSMANALIQDPIAEQQSSLFSGFLATVGVVMIFVTNTHHLMLSAIADSYTLFVPGQPLIIGDFSEVVARRVNDSFALGVKITSPIIVTGLTYYLGLGLLTRLMPALPVFFFGMPVQIGMQIMVTMIIFSTLMMTFMSSFEETYRAFVIP